MSYHFLVALELRLSLMAAREALTSALDRQLLQIDVHIAYFEAYTRGFR